MLEYGATAMRICRLSFAPFGACECLARDRGIANMSKGARKFPETRNVNKTIYWIVKYESQLFELYALVDADGVF